MIGADLWAITLANEHKRKAIDDAQFEIDKAAILKMCSEAAANGRSYFIHPLSFGKFSTKLIEFLRKEDIRVAELFNSHETLFSWVPETHF